MQQENNDDMVPFDYERYLAGEDVFYRSGEKFQGEIFKLKNPLIESNGEITFVAIDESGVVEPYGPNGNYYLDGKLCGDDLLMKPKEKKKKKLYMSEWINVEDRLPEFEYKNPHLQYSKHVICLANDRKLRFMHFTNRGYWINYEGYGSIINEDVLYWTELPEFPDELKPEFWNKIYELAIF